MDHMPISGNEPSSVSLTQTKVFQKLKMMMPNVPKQGKAKRDGVIDQQNNNFKQSLRYFNANKLRYWLGL